jgi:hypothetical protein
MKELDLLPPTERAQLIYVKFLQCQHEALSSYFRKKIAKECAALHLKMELETLRNHLTDEGIKDYNETINQLNKL